MYSIIMSSEAHEEKVAQENDETRVSGCVKWFNNKSGYGFITATEGIRQGEDVFVHHTAVSTDEDQYKYLVQGEHVEFSWSETNSNEDHKWQAGNVKGANGGNLMCETRNNARNASGEHRMKPRNNVRGGRSMGRYRGGGPRTMRDEEGVEWLLVRRKETR